MSEKSEYTLEELFKKLPISISELARRSGISEVTVSSIRNGNMARQHTLNKLLSALSEVYSVELTVDNVQGLRIMRGRYGEKSVA